MVAWSKVPRETKSHFSKLFLSSDEMFHFQVFHPLYCHYVLKTTSSYLTLQVALCRGSETFKKQSSLPYSKQ